MLRLSGRGCPCVGVRYDHDGLWSSPLYISCSFLNDFFPLFFFPPLFHAGPSFWFFASHSDIPPGSETKVVTHQHPPNSGSPPFFSFGMASSTSPLLFRSSGLGPVPSLTMGKCRHNTPRFSFIQLHLSYAPYDRVLKSFCLRFFFPGNHLSPPPFPPILINANTCQTAWPCSR